MGQIPVFINTISKRPGPLIYISPIAALAYNGKRSTWFWQTPTAFKDSNINYLVLCRKIFLTPDVEQEFSNCSMHQSHPGGLVNSTSLGLGWTWQSALLVGCQVALMLLVQGLHMESNTTRETHQISLSYNLNRMHTYHQICFVAVDRQLRHLFLLVLWPNFQISLVRVILPL